MPKRRCEQIQRILTRQTPYSYTKCKFKHLLRVESFIYIHTFMKNFLSIHIQVILKNAHRLFDSQDKLSSRSDFRYAYFFYFQVKDQFGKSAQQTGRKAWLRFRFKTCQYGMKKYFILFTFAFSARAAILLSGQVH